MGGASNTWGKGKVYTEFWWGNLKEGKGVVGRIILRWIFKK